MYIKSKELDHLVNINRKKKSRAVIHPQDINRVNGIEIKLRL